MNKKKYVVKLTKVERERLSKLLSSGTAPARMLNRAPRVLLKADLKGSDAWADERIAQALTPASPPWGGCASASAGRGSTPRWRAVAAGQGLRALAGRARRG